MVGISFKPSFEWPIRTKEKRQTIRLPRKRAFRAGDGLQFFCGPRMRPVRWGSAICLQAREVRLDFRANTVLLDDVEEISTPDDLDAFAIRDGFRTPARFADRFRPWEYMGEWWSFTHPAQPVFLGVLVDWGETFEPAP